jgi:hypothetical protein
VERLYTKAILGAFARNPAAEDRAMARSLTPEQVEQADQLSADIRAQAEDIFREVAELLSTVPDAQLFGDTEFAVRDRVLKLVAHAYTARLAQKKTATSAPGSTARAAAKPPLSTATVGGRR